MSLIGGRSFGRSARTKSLKSCYKDLIFGGGETVFLSSTSLNSCGIRAYITPCSLLSSSNFRIERMQEFGLDSACFDGTDVDCFVGR